MVQWQNKINGVDLTAALTKSTFDGKVAELLRRRLRRIMPVHHALPADSASPSDLHATAPFVKMIIVGVILDRDEVCAEIPQA